MQNIKIQANLLLGEKETAQKKKKKESKVTTLIMATLLDHQLAHPHCLDQDFVQDVCFSLHTLNIAQVHRSELFQEFDHFDCICCL